MSHKRYHQSSIIFFLIILFQPLELRAELVDRIVAAVNNEVIAVSDLNKAVIFNATMSGVQPDGNLRAETLDGLINGQLLLQEARRLRFVEVSDQEVSAEVDKLKKRLGPEKAFMDFLARLDVTEEQLARMLGERLLVEKFVEKKLGLFVRVSRDEAQRYFDEHAAAFKGKRFSDVQKRITSLLFEQKLEQQVAQYLADLRSKADIRVNPTG